MDKVPVVFLSHVFDEVREGPAIYARYLYNYFKNSDLVDFHIVVPATEQAESNIHIAGSGGSSLEKYRRLQLKAIEVAGSLGNPLVHGNYAHGMWLFREYPGPLLVQVNDYDPAEILKNTKLFMKEKLLRRYCSLLWRRYQEKRLLPRADRILANSVYTKGALTSQYGIPGERIQVLYKAVDTSNFVRPEHLPADPFPLKGKGKRLVFVGSNWRRKGLEVLLHALVLLREKIPDIALDIIGPGREDLSTALRQLIEGKQLASSVYFSGGIDRQQLPAHFWHADLCVLPSHQEALGVSILEALAAGVPVVASNVGGIPEILDDFNCGELVQAGDVNELAGAILHLLEEPAKLESMGNAGLARAQDFEVAKMLSAVENLYLQYGR